MAKLFDGNVDDWSLGQIKAQLEEDGYAHLAGRAAEIKRAAAHGALMWTETHLITVDQSRIHEFPARPE